MPGHEHQIAPGNLRLPRIEDAEIHAWEPGKPPGRPPVRLIGQKRRLGQSAWRAVLSVLKA